MVQFKHGGIAGGGSMMSVIQRVVALSTIFGMLLPMVIADVAEAAEIVEGASFTRDDVYEEHFMCVAYSHTATGTSLIKLYDPDGNLATTYTCLKTGTRLNPYEVKYFTYYFDTYRSGDPFKTVSGTWKMFFDSCVVGYDYTDFINVGLLVMDLSSKRGVPIYDFSSSTEWGKRYNLTLYDKLPTTLNGDVAGVGEEITLEAKSVTYFGTMGCLELNLVVNWQDRNHYVRNEILDPHLWVSKMSSWDPNIFSTTNPVYGTLPQYSKIEIPYNEEGCARWVNLSYPTEALTPDDQWTTVRGLSLGLRVGLMTVGIGGAGFLFWISAASCLISMSPWALEVLYGEQYEYVPDMADWTSDSTAGFQLMTSDENVQTTYDWHAVQVIRLWFDNTRPAGTTFCFSFWGSVPYFDGAPVTSGCTENLFFVIKI